MTIEQSCYDGETYHIEIENGLNVCRHLPWSGGKAVVFA